MIVTYQTRVRDYAELERADGDAALSAYADLYGKVERKLFAEVAAGRPAASLKREYLRRYGIPARMFNGVRVSLEGKIASVREQQKLRVEDMARTIVRAESQVAAAEQDGLWNRAHQKRRRLAQSEAICGRFWKPMLPRVGCGCALGPGRLWHKQHNPEANGYASHRGVAG